MQDEMDEFFVVCILYTVDGKQTVIGVCGNQSGLPQTPNLKKNILKFSTLHIFKILGVCGKPVFSNGSLQTHIHI